ncbi:hypothetical protein GUITHDRAFT_111448 [Guillardia theta CCMP2712]|uniref:Uncharacterized protein n=1 Tax=Guillardia theta (strain CCMP2712) TaxID=905079 RepID=L1J307_GUITC|nr:hypothetical protein GUITHDRAFT_111448 [Guillardia theta CCMP2712]EKX42475.1 hypothetical protein GUITHDRAFT_111448 [Guillardia theta CCMP2712]|eukprot:XP_005829455.1 hypothetical protein GUITHDRAFT_111448 [Guillardia theta CCMP2712]
MAGDDVIVIDSEESMGEGEGREGGSGRGRESRDGKSMRDRERNEEGEQGKTRSKALRNRRSSGRSESAFARADLAFSCPICGHGFHAEREVTMHVEWCAAKEDRKSEEGGQAKRQTPAEQRDGNEEKSTEQSSARRELSEIRPSSLNAEKEGRARKDERSGVSLSEAGGVFEGKDYKVEKNKSRMEKLKLKKRKGDNKTSLEDPPDKSSPAAQESTLPHLKVTSFFTSACRQEVERQGESSEEQILERMAAQGCYRVPDEVRVTCIRSVKAKIKQSSSSFALPEQQTGKAVQLPTFTNFWAEQVLTRKIVFHEFPR